MKRSNLDKQNCLKCKSVHICIFGNFAPQVRQLEETLGKKRTTESSDDSQGACCTARASLVLPLISQSSL